MQSYILCILTFVCTLLVTVLLEQKLIPFLMRRAAQPIYEEGPSWHIKKAGTPTMGGIAFAIAISLSLVSLSFFLTFLKDGKSIGISILISALFALGNCLIGIFDDLMKLYRNKNAGLSPIQKLTLQALLSVLFLMARRHFLQDGTTLTLPFSNIDLGILYYPLAIFLLLGIINCANLTDGIDGLASSVAVTIGIVFLLIGNNVSMVLPFISSALIGGVLGFLYFNTHPAKIFMGDTGSLFLGALTVSLAFSINPLLIIPIGIIYVIEGFSVILQVAYFKLTKKRLFKMAPIHHHLEKCGMDENRICILAVMITLLFSCLSIFLLKN